jgi:O-antigen biosynthesis protein
MPKQLVDLDVIVPVFGRPDLLRRCLDSVLDTIGDISYKLIVVDDCSPNKPEMEEVYKDFALKARIERNDRNLGFPATINKGVRIGYAPLILLLNSDVILHPGCIASLMEEMKDQDVGVVGGRLLFPKDDQHGAFSGTTQHCGHAFNIHAQIIHPCLGWRDSHPKTMRRRDNLCSVTGALFLTRHKIWDVLGGFDEGYSRGGWEEVELCTRVRAELNGKIVYTPNAVATHYAGASAMIDGKGFPLMQNRLRFLERCGARIVWDEFLAW